IIALSGFSLLGATADVLPNPGTVDYSAEDVAHTVTPNVSASDAIVITFLTVRPGNDGMWRVPNETQLYGVGRTGSFTDNSGHIAGYREHVEVGEGQPLTGPLFVYRAYSGSEPPIAITLFGSFPEELTPPDPVIPPPETFAPEVLIDGVIADIDTVRVQSDSPAHLAIPPKGG